MNTGHTVRICTVLPLTSPGVLGESLNHSGPQFPHLQRSKENTGLARLSFLSSSVEMFSAMSVNAKRQALHDLCYREPSRRQES